MQPSSRAAEHLIRCLDKQTDGKGRWCWRLSSCHWWSVDGFLCESPLSNVETDAAVDRAAAGPPYVLYLRSTPRLGPAAPPSELGEGGMHAQSSWQNVNGCHSPAVNGLIPLRDYGVHNTFVTRLTSPNSLVPKGKQAQPHTKLPKTYRWVVGIAVLYLLAEVPYLILLLPARIHVQCQ